MGKTGIFAAIDIGSYALGMKIYELNEKRGIRELDYVSHSIALGTDTYTTGRISASHVNELVGMLKDFRRIMKTYDTADCRVCATSAFRESSDREILLNRIFQETGFEVRILSNSEQRFLDYKSVALHGEDFRRCIEKPTAILDLGGGSIQLSIFDNDKLTATQNMRLGILRLLYILQKLDALPTYYRPYLHDIASPHIANFKKMYLKDRKIRNLILVDDYLSPYLYNNPAIKKDSGVISISRFSGYLDSFLKKPGSGTAESFGIPDERLPLVLISAILIDYIAAQLSAKELWAPGVTLCDGIAYDYAERKKYLQDAHDFDRDILASARNMSARYTGSRKRAEALSAIATGVFDEMKKMHGLGKRERLLLQISAILQDCGKYISMQNMSESASHIILSTEMIGLAHRERQIVAETVRLAHSPFEEQEDFEDTPHIDGAEDRMTTAKLAAILRLSCGLCMKHPPGIKNVSVKLKDRMLTIVPEDSADMELEKGLFDIWSSYFRKVYGVSVRIGSRKDRDAKVYA